MVNGFDGGVNKFDGWSCFSRWAVGLRIDVARTKVHAIALHRKTRCASNVFTPGVNRFDGG